MTLSKCSISLYILIHIFTIILHAKTLQHQQPCPVTSPCKCSGVRILCGGLNLTEVPKFHKVNTTYSGWGLDLGTNCIKHIPSRAFENLKNLGSLTLSENPFVSFADDAFYGCEDSLDSIFMHSNNLTELPEALGKLRKLTFLSIEDNPFVTLSDDVTKNLSNSLLFLEMGSPQMTAWPRGITNLKTMSEVVFISLPFEDLPEDAFRGLEQSLTYIEFDSCNFTRFPKALQTLSNLKTLIIDTSVALTSESFTNETFIEMRSLLSLSITTCGMTEVPDISQLSNLTTINLSGSPIVRWDEKTLPKRPALVFIGLDETKLERIPPAIAKLKHLSQLSLFESKIKMITDFDFVGLSNLTMISLSRCPLRHISINAFRTNKALKILRFDSTKIEDFPKATNNLPKLQTLDLSDDNIHCTCAAMGWTKNWSGLNHTWIEGSCINLNKMSIRTYIETEIPKC